MAQSFQLYHIVAIVLKKFPKVAKSYKAVVAGILHNIIIAITIHTFGDLQSYMQL